MKSQTRKEHLLMDTRDVVEYCKTFLRKMATLGFLNEDIAPTEEARKALPTDLDPPRPEVLSKTVFIFHDETTFQANDD